jgi:hypothetical protein
MLVKIQSVGDIYLWVANFICVDKTRIWGFRPPVPPLKGGVPPLKLPCTRVGLFVA